MSRIGYTTYKFPIRGLDSDQSFHAQREDTTVSCSNVWPYDPQEGRQRGGQRDGLSKYLAAQLSGTVQMQDIAHIVTANTDTPSLSSAVTRDITAVAVAAGTAKKFTSAGYSSITNGTNAFHATNPYVFSAPLFQHLYYADGTNAKRYSPGTNTISTWTPTAGSLPINGSDRPRLIELWRQRLVQSGIKSDPHNWFMSATGDALNWDYSPETTVETQAVAGNSAPAGEIGDVVNTMIPHNDDLLLFGCDHSIWQMTGDPMAGGRIDNISPSTGMAFGRPWCKIPSGDIFFVGARGGLYRMAPTILPHRITSGRVDAEFSDHDMSNTMVRLIYDDKRQGVFIFFTLLDGTATTHYFFDLRTESFWPINFGNTGYSPTTVHVFDGDSPDDRVVLLGSLDGYMRFVDDSVVNDDGTPIDSHVYIGPIKSRGQARMMLREIRAVLDTDCLVEYLVYQGDSAQQAFERTESIIAGSWGNGRNNAERRRAQGHVFYIRVGNQFADESWGMEHIQIGRTTLGPSHSRRTE